MSDVDPSDIDAEPPGWEEVRARMRQPVQADPEVRERQIARALVDHGHPAQTAARFAARRITDRARRLAIAAAMVLVVGSVVWVATTASGNPSTATARAAGAPRSDREGGSASTTAPNSAATARENPATDIIDVGDVPSRNALVGAFSVAEGSMPMSAASPERAPGATADEVHPHVGSVPSDSPATTYPRELLREELRRCLATRGLPAPRAGEAVVGEIEGVPFGAVRVASEPGNTLVIALTTCADG